MKGTWNVERSTSEPSGGPRGRLEEVRVWAAPWCEREMASEGGRPRPVGRREGARRTGEGTAHGESAVGERKT